VPSESPMPTSVNAASDSANRLPRQTQSRERRRSQEVRDEMRLFNTRGSREQPPTCRASGHVRQMGKKTDSASQESDERLSGIVGRARSDSLADDSSASFLAVRSVASDPGALRGADASCSA
jgi:hypothetical protein